MKKAAMYQVYVLYSKKYDKIYIGHTSDIKRRLAEHNSPENSGYTKRYQPWEVLLTEIYNSRSEAMKREKQLKGAKGRGYIWGQVKERHRP